jgi:hypothetical protein
MWEAQRKESGVKRGGDGGECGGVFVFYFFADVLLFEKKLYYEIPLFLHGMHLLIVLMY